MANRNMKTVDYVVVRTLSELKTAIAPFSKNGRENARKLLIDGLLNVKAQIEEHERAMAEIEKYKDEFGGFMPAPMQNPANGYHYVDEIVSKKLGGKRFGHKIRWSTIDGQFEWDAIEDKLIQCGK